MLELVIALVTILAPILSVGVVSWAESIKAKQNRKNDDDVDLFITQHLTSDPAGIRNLATQLERLQREADRKRHHP